MCSILCLYVLFTSLHLFLADDEVKVSALKCLQRICGSFSNEVHMVFGPKLLDLSHDLIVFNNTGKAKFSLGSYNT